MTLAQLIAKLRGQVAAKLEQRATQTSELAELRGLEVTDENTAKAEALLASRAALDTEITDLQSQIANLEAEQARDNAADELSRQVSPTETRRPTYDGVARVGAEKRTYNPDDDKRGTQFLRDLGRQFLNIDPDASERIARHMREEKVERAAFFERAAGTGAFAGLTVPQYLTDLYAPAAKANRPFADACNHHDLPADGMTVNLSRITTGTSAAVQAAENNAVSETNIDDTLLTINVKTNAGQQTLSRQAIERGTGIEAAMLDDLFRAYATNLDSTLINEAATGLTNVATAIAYTDATPTVAELYPLFSQGLSAVEAALLDQDPGDNIAVMHSRRWYWLQNALSTSHPLVGQPGVASFQAMTNLAETYGKGVRGVLPNGTPVIVDNNIATNLGGGTEDEIYILSRREAHLWEDPSAPLLIRAEQTNAASLGVLFVVYGYFAYTHARYTQAQKINGTGLAAPTWTGA